MLKETEVWRPTTKDKTFVHAKRNKEGFMEPRPSNWLSKFSLDGGDAYHEAQKRTRSLP